MREVSRASLSFHREFQRPNAYYRACCHFGPSPMARSRWRGLLTVCLAVVVVAFAPRLLCAFTLVVGGGFQIIKAAGATCIREGRPVAQTVGGGEDYLPRLPKRLGNRH